MPGADPAPSSAGRGRSGAAPLTPSADPTLTGADDQRSGAEQATKRQHAQRVWATLAAQGEPVTGAQLAAATGLSPSYARALAAEFHTHPPTRAQANGDRSAQAAGDPEAGP
jgi:hypothetical protein